jgi:hypothetical protein
MNDPSAHRIRSVSELPRDIPPPRDLWPAIEARLRESATSGCASAAGRASAVAPVRRRRPGISRIAALAAVLGALGVGMSIDRWVLSPANPTPRPAATRVFAPGGGAPPVVSLTDPKFLRERAALLRSLDAQLARLPPPTRRKVLASLATVHRSMRQIQEALGREPGNALLQALLIDSYQNEMQVLATVQEASGGSGEI